MNGIKIRHIGLVVAFVFLFTASAQAHPQLGGYPTTRGQRGPAFTKHGIVQRDPRIVLVMWGWTGSQFQQDIESALQTEFGELAWSSWGNILAQYGVHNDARLEATVEDPIQPRGKNLRRIDFEKEILHAQKIAHITNTFDTQWVVMAPGTIHLAWHFESECGEHDGFNLDHHRYNFDMIMPVDKAPWSSGCVGDLTPEQALTETVSHEYAEDATNPMQNHNDGWWIRVGKNGLQEIADICDWQGAVPPGMDVMMQAIWSNASEGPNKNRGCVITMRGGASQ